MVGSYSEKILGAKLREGLWDAVQASDAVTAEDIDSIRFQKLLLEAVEEFDLEDEITVEWFLDGDLVATDKTTVQAAKADANPLLDRANEFHTQRHPTVEQISEFYVSLFQEYCDTLTGGTFRYLRDYYQNHEDIPYRELYLRNLDIDQCLMRAKDGLENGREIRDEEIETFENSCRDLKTELLLYEEFAQVPMYVDVFETAGQALLTQIRDNEVDTDTAATAIDEFDRFYYNDLWRTIALIISYNNSSGNSASDNRDSRADELSNMTSRYRSEYEGLSDWMGQQGLDLPPLPDTLPELSIDADRSNVAVESATLSDSSIPQEIRDTEPPDDDELETLLGDDNRDEPISELLIAGRREE